MHPELLSSLAAERRRDLAAAMTAAPARRPPARAWRVPRADPAEATASPWTRTTLAAVAGSRRGRSLVIVISATRTSASRGRPAAAPVTAAPWSGPSDQGPRDRGPAGPVIRAR